VGANNLPNGNYPNGLKCISPHIIKIELTNPYPPFLFVLASSGFGIIKKSSGLHNLPVGSGKYIPQINGKDKSILLKPKDSQFPTIILTEVASETLLVNNFEKYDLAIGYSNPLLMDNIKNNKFYKLEKFNSLGYLHLFTNTSHPLLRNKKFRKDLLLLIRSEIRKSKALAIF
jgi:ABC-type transport system substrate-binding protein